MYELSGFQRIYLYCVAALNEPNGQEIGRGWQSTLRLR